MTWAVDYTRADAHPVVVAMVSIFIGVTAILLPLFLLVARWMRDDYAEALWRRTAIIFTYAMAPTPFAIVTGSWAVYGYSMQIEGSDELYKNIFDPLFRERPGNSLIAAFYKIYMAVFVIIFQFLRWKDSR